MLGPYIDCDHQKQSGNKDKQKEEKEKNGEQNKDKENKNNNKLRHLAESNDDVYCSRWVMWASYVNPNYQGNAYYEYFGNSPTSYLDCHEDGTSFKLVGVYRQELYQFYEQISKHLWAIDEYEYIVAIAGLKYMTNADCRQVGNDNYGNAIYGGVAPQPNADIAMELYSDNQCTQLLQSSKYTYASFGLESNYQGTSYSGQESTWWSNAQEPSMTLFNEVYEIYKSCTPCVDYPTYQDGYFKGNDGTEDGYLINQCWKFYSHNSYTCNGDCISMANAQGTIMQFNYQGNTFGYGAPKETFNSGYTSATTSKATTTTASAPFANFKANAYIGLSTVLFIGTFLAFAIARASARAFDKKMKSQYLLFDEDDAGKKKSSSRSTARSKSTETRRSERQKKSTKSPSASKSQRSTRSKSKARDIDSHRDLDTPVKSSRSASRSKKERISSSRVVQEDEPPRRSSSRRKERDRDADYRRYYDDDF